MIRVYREGLKIEGEQKEERMSGVGGGMWGRQWLCTGGGGPGSVAVGGLGLKGNRESKYFSNFIKFSIFL